MAKQIIVLETNPADGGFISVRCAFWYHVPAGKEWPITGRVSAWRGATAADNQALAGGQDIEEVKTYSYPSTTATATIKASLVNNYASWNAYQTSKPFPGQFYGVYFDSSNTW